MTRYASIRKRTIQSATCNLELDIFIKGSVLRGDVRAGATACRSEMVIESPESREDIAELVRLAKRGCFAEQILVNPLPIESKVVVNGIPMSADEAGLES